MSGPLSSVRPEKPTVVDLTVTWRDHETETFKGVVARPEGAWLVVTFPPGTEGRMWPADTILEVTARAAGSSTENGEPRG